MPVFLTGAVISWEGVNRQNNERGGGGVAVRGWGCFPEQMPEGCTKINAPPGWKCTRVLQLRLVESAYLHCISKHLTIRVGAVTSFRRSVTLNSLFAAIR